MIVFARKLNLPSLQRRSRLGWVRSASPRVTRTSSSCVLLGSCWKRRGFNKKKEKNNFVVSNVSALEEFFFFFIIYLKGIEASVENFCLVCYSISFVPLLFTLFFCICFFHTRFIRISYNSWVFQQQFNQCIILQIIDSTCSRSFQDE